MRGDWVDTVPWLTAWAILTSSCFGVVLEGPMGAVLFWTAVGIGCAAKMTSQIDSATPLKENRRVSDSPAVR